MDNLRSHIIKIGLICSICFGLLLTLVQPLQASSSSNHFEVWLQQVAENDSVFESAQYIKVSEFDSLIEQAVALAHQKGESLDLSGLAESFSGDLLQLLLIEWNHYRNGNAMTAIPPAPTVKPMALHSNQPLFTGNGNTTGAKEAFLPSFLILNDLIRLSASDTITPLINGIAIGAP